MEHLQIFEGKEELINDFSPKIPISEEYYDELLKTTEIFKKEKELLYSSIFILGTDSEFGKAKKVCAPLLLFPARLEKTKESRFVSIEQDNFRINSSALNLLIQAAGKNSEVEVKIAADFQKPPFDYGAIGQVSRLLKTHFPKLDKEPLLFFPELWSSAKIKRGLQPKQLAQQEFYKIIPASGLAVMNKSNNNYGILSELGELETSKYFSKPLVQLLTASADLKQNKHHEANVPAVLSAGQKTALSNAYTQDISVIIGPPGTGKSFTISSIAIDYMMNKKTVLISSRQDEAVDVVLRNINKLLNGKDIPLKAGGRRNISLMRKKLAQLLVNKKKPITNDNWSSVHAIERESTGIKKRLQKLENELKERLAEEINGSKLFAEEKPSSMKAWYLKLKAKWKTPHWEILEAIHSTTQEIIESNRNLALGRYSTKLVELLKTNRKSVENLYQALRSSTSSDLEKTMAKVNFDTIFQTFPIWLCKLTEINKMLPLQREMFDLLIIDEASQCDMASILPAMQRAKKVVFCGDPQQLRHISFLSRLKMEVIGTDKGLNPEEKSRFNFRSNSVLDLVNMSISSQDQLSYLNEHFRSEPSIINFSNQEFYDGGLRIMTEKPIPNNDLGVFHFPIMGMRNSKGYNEEEANAILEEVIKITEEEKDLDKNLKTSIGILSPFRDQVNYISLLIKKSMEIKTIQDHLLSVGTAFSFQGEERDLMLLSFAVDKNSHHSALYHLSKEDVFNVSITRAKNRQFLYYSIDPILLKPEHNLRKLLASTEIKPGQQEPTPESEISHHQFLDEVLQFTKTLKAKTWVYFPIAGIPIDLLLKVNDQYFGIDLIGYPGKYEDAISVGRYKILSRTGIPIFPLPYSNWKFYREDCEMEIRRFMSLDIKEV